MEVPRSRLSPEPHKRRLVGSAPLLVATALFLASVTLTIIVGAVLSGRLDRLEQQVEALQQ